LIGDLKEKAIENQILTWFNFKGILAFKVKSTGTYDEKLKRFRRAAANYRVGVSDILGIYKGKFLAVEVKSAKGRLSPRQETFLYNVRCHGGIAIMARSVEDLEQQLKVIDVKMFDKGKE
jgi:penicillin-binding protein-related factor A (putative recombinase)